VHKDGVEKGRHNKKILLYCWPPTGTHHKNIMIFWKFLLFLKPANLGHFFHGKSYFLGLKFGERVFVLDKKK
jgi:hypothetical protein